MEGVYEFVTNIVYYWMDGYVHNPKLLRLTESEEGGIVYVPAKQEWPLEESMLPPAPSWSTIPTASASVVQEREQYVPNH
jgi:hypothetical protein